MNKNRRQLLDDVFDAFTILAQGNFVSLYDIKGRETRYSKAYADLFGFPGEYIPDGALDWVDYIHPDDKARYLDVMGNLLTAGNLFYDLSYRVRMKDGSYGLFRFVGAVIRDDDGAPSLVGGMTINEGMIENTDPATILRNQNGFFMDLAALRDTNQNATVLLLGLNKLSEVNESHGYGYGNKLLQQVGWVLQETIGQDGIIYRMEGPRFAFMTKTLDEKAVAAAYKKVRQRLQSGIEINGIKQSLMVNGSVIGNVGSQTMSDRAILTCLSHAYKESKEKKHGALVSFSGIENRDAEQTLLLIDKIRKCMIEDFEGFFLEYQPVYNYENGKTIGVEALLRWRDQETGEVVMPEEFVPVLEQDIAFEELGMEIVRMVMRESKAFFAKNPDYVVGMDIAAVQLEDDFFIESIVQIAEQNDFPLSNLCLELTKDCRMLEQSLLQTRVEEARKERIRILLDDFGSGFGSLELLKTLQSDYVKLDKKFVENIDKDERDRQDLRSLCEMAAVHGPNVCVKGVETEAIRDVLKGFPVSSVQGFCYSEPVSAETILERFL